MALRAALSFQCKRARGQIQHRRGRETPERKRAHLPSAGPPGAAGRDGGSWRARPSRCCCAPPLRNPAGAPGKQYSRAGQAHYMRSAVASAASGRQPSYIVVLASHTWRRQGTNHSSLPAQRGSAAHRCQWSAARRPATASAGAAGAARPAPARPGSAARAAGCVAGAGGMGFGVSCCAVHGNGG